MGEVESRTFYVNGGLDGFPDIEDIKGEIVNCGGKLAGRLGPECDVLVVGPQEPDNKVDSLELARQLVEKGQELQIVDANQLLEMLEEAAEGAAHHSDQTAHSFEIGALLYNYCHSPPVEGARQLFRTVYNSHPVSYREAIRIKRELLDIVKLVDDCGLKHHENCDILPAGWRVASLPGVVVGVNDDSFSVSQRLLVLLDSEGAKENGPSLSELVKEFVRIRIGHGRLSSRIWDESYVHARRWAKRLGG